MNAEDRLRDALRGEAERVNPIDGWARIEEGINAMPRRSNYRYLAIAAAAALVLVAAVAVIAQRDDDKTPVIAERPPETTTSTSTTTTTTTTTTTAALPAAPAYLWPFDYSGTYRTPEALAEAYAKDFLGMPTPRISEYRAGDSRSGEIDVHPSPRGTMGSRLVVREDADGWHVVSAESDNLELDTPERNDLIKSPARLTGRSISFEGTVRVAVLQYGTTMRCVYPTDSCGANHGVLANTFFTGSGDEKRPFTTDVTFDRSSTRFGLIVLWTESGENGTLAEATVRLVRFS